MAQTLVFGVDGGGTRTRCLLATSEGEALGVGLSGPSNYHFVGVEATKRALVEALERAFSSAGLARAECGAGCAGLAGLDCGSDERFLGASLSGLGLARELLVVHDSVVALYGALGGRAGVIVVAGTGSVAAGVNKAGQTVRAGGWGPLMGDEGSAYWIGAGGVRAALWSMDGRGPKTVLEQRVRDFLGLESLDEIVKSVYVEGMAPSEFARIAPLVTQAASEGDRLAISLLEEAGLELGRLALAVARRLGLERGPFEVAAVGGVLKAGDLVIGPFARSMAEGAPQARFVQPRFSPAVGAVLLALRRLGVELSEELLGRLDASAKAFSAQL